MRIATLAALVLSSGAAWANGRPPGPTSVSIRPGAPSDIVEGATFGAFFTRDGGKSWRWSCEQVAEYVTGPDPHWVWLDADSLAASTANGLFVTRDRGCSFAAAPGTGGLLAEDVEVDPNDPSRVYVLLVDDDQKSTLLRSTDAARTFPETLLGPTEPGRYLTALEIAPSDPRHIYVVSTIFSPRAAAIQHSPDGGKSWEELPLDSIDIHLAAVDPLTPTTLYAYTRSPGVLLRSVDAGRSFQPLLTVDGIVFSFAASRERLWLGETRALHRSEDRETFAPVAGAPRASCLVASGTDVYACADPFLDGYAVGVSNDGAPFVPFLRDYADSPGPLVCPDGSPSRALCDPQWPAILGGGPPPVDAGVPDAAAPPPTPTSKGCGCVAGGRPSVAPLVLALVLAWGLLSSWRARPRKRTRG